MLQPIGVPVLLQFNANVLPASCVLWHERGAGGVGGAFCATNHWAPLIRKRRNLRQSSENLHEQR